MISTSFKVKLIFSYGLLALVITTSLLVFTDKMFLREFNKYVIQNQERKINSIIYEVTNLFKDNHHPSYKELKEIGHKSMEDGIVFMYNTSLENQVFCMSTEFPRESNQMFVHMENVMRQFYPDFDGEYIEKYYEIEVEGKNYGYVTLGMFGPFYYNNFEATLIQNMKYIYLIIGITFILISIAFGYIMSKTISAPLKKISLKTKEIEKGNYKEKLDFNSSTTEIKDLIYSINHLAYVLDSQSKIKKQMAQNYAHEIRTPLTCIQSTIEGILDGVLDNDVERLEMINDEVLRLSQIISSLDTLTQTSEQKLELNNSNFDLILLAQNILLAFDIQLKEKNISFRIVVNTKEENCYINADKDLMKQVLINLISNAIKYTNENGDISLVIDYKKKKHIISVIDNGIGIEESELEYIFEHLYRVDKSRVKEVEGYGIGLSIVKNIVEAHNGTIEVKSTVNEGSEFKIIL